MDETSDSDDSAFLFTMSQLKRTRLNVRTKENKLRLSSHDENKINSEMERQKISESNTVNVDFPMEENKVYLMENEMLQSSEKNAEKLIAEENPPKAGEYYSCALCLKIFHSETAHLTHMKQCAKKSKMNTKQLLEALQLHKRHLKERMSAGLSNIPQKKKKIHTEEKNEDSENQLALGLALSKSLVAENVAGKENQNIACSVSIENSNNTTLEKFGFKSSGKIKTGTGKNARNGRITYSVLRERTKEDREKLVTEKASVILLVNNYAVTSESREPLRMYHCKRLEERRNKDSCLWRLGQMVDVTEWYVNDLKHLILEGSNKVENEIRETVHQERINIEKEILKLNLPNNKIFQDWRKLINAKHLSDISLSAKDGETIYLHSVVIYARCPKLLDVDVKTIFQKFHSQIILKFLQFLYCGTLNELLGEEVDDLLNLAQSVNCSELVEILNNLKKLLTASEISDENCNGAHQLDISSTFEYKKMSPVKIDNWDRSECRDFSTFERTINCSPTVSEKSESTQNEYHEWNKIQSDEFCQDSKKVKLGTEDELTNKLLKEKSGTPKCSEPSTYSDTSNTEKTSDGIENLNIYKKGNQLDEDLFEELENLRSITKNDSKAIPEDDQECIVLSSSSSKSNSTNADIVENAEDKEEFQPEMDFEVPYFDPYEHFIDEIPDVEAPNALSQSLMVGEISPVKSSSSQKKDPSELIIASPGVSAPEYCSTPNIDAPPVKISTEATLPFEERIERARKRRRCGTPCSKINRKSARFPRRSKALGSRSTKQRKSDLDEVNPETLAGILTKSIMRDFESSMMPSAKETPSTKEKSYIEMTPAIPGEEYSENVSPLPDYSVMGASAIKKHLSKYGLKKSLSKNKAKKILRHIYEELHPMVNMKNGKIVKFIRSNKSKKSRKSKTGVGVKKRRRGNSARKESASLTGGGGEKSEACCSGLETPIRKTNDTLESLSATSPRSTRGSDLLKSPKVTPSKSQRTTVEGNSLKSPHATPSKSPRSAVEDDSQSWTSLDSDDDGCSGSSGLPDGNYSEAEESLSQGNYESAEDAFAAVHDFIESNEAIHRKILTYEPILLEQFQKQLFEKYNKKYRLTHLMDCLDDECITFYCESPKKKKKNSQKEKEDGSPE